MSAPKAQANQATAVLRQAAISSGLLLALQAAALLPVSTVAAIAAMAMFLGASLIVRHGLLRFYPYGLFGACNAVTLARAAVACGLVVTVTDAGRFASEPALAWAVAAAASVSLLLDGVDGWLARHSGLVSAFGARFDMEVDAALALVLALGLLAQGKAGTWILLLGGLRYLFVAAMRLAPWLAAPLPARQSRRTVCVVQIAALIALHAPLLLPPVSTMLGAAATAALVWSFAVDVVWLWHRS